MELYNIEKARRMIVLLRRVFEQNKKVMRRMEKISIWIDVFYVVVLEEEDASFEVTR